MFDDWRRSRAAKRVKPGDGRALQRFRWCHLFSRALFNIRLSDSNGRQVNYALDVPRRRDPGYDFGKGKAHLYLDGRHHAESRIPAAFLVHDGAIEVAVSRYGIKRAHYVTDVGEEQQLTPDPNSAEGRRGQLDRLHPALSRWMGLCSVMMLITGAILLMLQLAEPISEIPPIAAAGSTVRETDTNANGERTCPVAAASTAIPYRRRYRRRTHH